MGRGNQPMRTPLMRPPTAIPLPDALSQLKLTTTASGFVGATTQGSGNTSSCRAPSWLCGAEIGMSQLGADGMLFAGDRSLEGMIQELCLFAPAVSIYGGTDQIQRNLLSERVLGLPRDESR